MRNNVEQWKTIDGFDGRYEISSLGIVRNRETGKILKHSYVSGYPLVRLCLHNEKFPRFVHRLVAEYYIPNPNNYPFINHKDENPANFSIDNLEWCTPKYNSNYGTCPECHRVPVAQFSMEGELIKVYRSISEASAQTGIRITGISDTINKRHKSAGGYRWEYIDRERGWNKMGYSKERFGIKPLYLAEQGEGTLEKTIAWYAW